MEMVDRKMRQPAKQLPSRDGRALWKSPHRSGIVVTVLFKGEKGSFLGTPSKGKTKARGPSSCPRAGFMNAMASKTRNESHAEVGAGKRSFPISFRYIILIHHEVRGHHRPAHRPPGEEDRFRAGRMDRGARKTRCARQGDRRARAARRCRA